MLAAMPTETMSATTAKTESNKQEFNIPGHLSSPDRLVNVPRLVTAFYARHPDVANPSERVSFGTSGHRGSALTTSFNYAHILAITQAICEYRANEKTTGPLFLAQDTHALSDPALATALEVLSANGVHVLIDKDLGYTPTPALSHAILTHNADPKAARADGIVITPSTRRRVVRRTQRRRSGSKTVRMS
jgi:phosphoglucomutase